MTRLTTACIMTFALAAAGCRDAAPRTIVEGEDSCARCHMGIAELRFAAQARTTTGKVLVFDSVECLAQHVLDAGGAPFAALHVTDFAEPGRWIPVQEARFLVESAIASPMGRSVAAFAAGAPMAETTGRHGGRLVAWSDVLALVERGAATLSHEHARPETRPHDPVPASARAFDASAHTAGDLR